MGNTTAGRRLGRKGGHRVALLRNLATDLLRYEQIQTTHAKAKECSRLADHLISVARKNDLNARRAVARDIHDREVLKKVFDVLVQRYASHPGGYTRIFRLPARQGDNAEMALLKLIV